MKHTLVSVALAAMVGGSIADCEAQQADTLKVSRRFGTAGGSVELSGYAHVVIPPAALAESALVTVAATRSSETARDFEQTVPIIVAARAPYEIRISTGNSGAPHRSVDVMLVVPAAILAAAADGARPLAFMQVFQEGGEEILDGFERAPPSTFDSTTRSVRVTLPPEAFTNRRREDGVFEAILVLAALPARR